MSKQTLLKSVTALMIGGLISAPAFADSWFSGSNHNSILEDAHRHFLQKDFEKAVRSIKSVLEAENSSETEKTNALTLLNASYKQRKNIEPDWRLPSEILSMKVKSTRKDHNEVAKYQLTLGGETKAERMIKQLQVIRYPDTIIFDKEAGIGEWEDSTWEGTPEYRASSIKSKSRIPDGLYLLKIELESGSITDGWFILSDQNASSSPTVLVPAENQVFETRNPTITFIDFTSPEYKSYEKRSRTVNLTRIWPGENRWEYVWGSYEQPPQTTEVRIDAESGLGADELADGSYWLSVGFQETVKFGDLKISRYSKKSVLFKVKAN